MRILGINGIRSNGARNTDQLLLRLAEKGWNVKDVNYPKVSALQFWVRGRKWNHARQCADAQYLVDAYEPGDALIAHSYGCLLALRAMQRGVEFSDVFLFAAALDSDVLFPSLGADNIYVIYNKKDWVLRIAALLRWHDSGDMGRIGYRGVTDARVVNVAARSILKHPMRHSGYFAPGNLGELAKWIDQKLTPV